jgi:hypothetical protein
MFYIEGSVVCYMSILMADLVLMFQSYPVLVHYQTLRMMSNGGRSLRPRKLQLPTITNEVATEIFNGRFNFFLFITVNVHRLVFPE